MKIAGGPFSGKTYLLRTLIEKGIPKECILETDILRMTLFEAEKLDYKGIDNDIWLAWDPTHPKHSTWLKIEQKHQEILSSNSNTIILTHSTANADAFLFPGADELFKRAKKYVEDNKPNATIRILACVHYYSKLLNHTLPMRTSAEVIKMVENTKYSPIVFPLKDAYLAILTSSLQPTSEADLTKPIANIGKTDELKVPEPQQLSQPAPNSSNRTLNSANIEMYSSIITEL